MNFLRAELYECEIPETEPSIAKGNVNFKRAELCECKLYVS